MAPLAIYSTRRSPDCYRAVVDLGMALGMSSGWLPDPGRLEDAICGTLRAIHAKQPIPQDAGSVFDVLDVSAPCSHGLVGIFGTKFAEALVKAGKMLIVEINVSLSDARLMFGDYRLFAVPST